MAGFGSLVPYGAPFGVMSPADQAEADAASGVNKVGVGLLNGLAGIPKALIEKAARDAAYTYGQAPITTEAQAADANATRSDLAGESAGAMFGVGGASIPFSFMRPGASAGVFGGRLAKTADHEKLAAAEKMAADGHAPTDIWGQTGWFQGPDKQWRFEIPDQDMAFKRIVNPGTIDNWPIDVPGKQSTLGGAINHPELFKAYPDLADVPFGIGSQSNKHLAAYRPRDPILDGLGKPESIELTALPSRYGDENKLAARSSTMHEVQHAIQHREGFARGGNPSSFASDKLGAEQMIEGVNDTLSSLAKQMNGVTDPVKKAELKAGYDRLMDYKLKELVPQAQIDPMAAYKRLAGETEARNVQTRLDWDSQKRSDVPPQFSQDIPNDQQIVRTTNQFGSLAPQMSAEKPAGFTAYHGSPYDFDKFDASKIGTGEGAQSFGHGLYFADKEGTAKAYREALAGKPFAHLEPHAIKNELADVGGFNKETIPWTRQVLADHRGDVNDTLRTLDAMSLNGVDQRAKEAAQIIRSMEPSHATKSPGKMYEVNINANPEHFLDWDAPFSAQPKNVQDFFAKRDPDMWHPSGSDFDPHEVGQISYNRLTKETYPIRDAKGEPWKASNAKTYDEALAMVDGDKSRVNRLRTPDRPWASDTLREGGVPGIRYLDQGSRMTATQEQAIKGALEKAKARGDDGMVKNLQAQLENKTRNYVVFDPSIMDIAKKYGLAGGAAVPFGIGAMQQDRQ